MFQSGKQSFSSEPGKGNDSTVPTTTISSPSKTKKLTIYRLSSHKDVPGAINASSLSESLKRTLFPTSQDHSVNAPTPSKLIKIMPGDQNKVKTGKKKKKSGGKNKVNGNISSPVIDTEGSDSGDSLNEENNKNVNQDFQSEVRSALKEITAALKGDGRAEKGLVKRVTGVEKDLYGGDKPETGLCTRVQNLESSLGTASLADSGTVSGSAALPIGEVQALCAQVALLEQSNAVLMGFSSKLQRRNKSLQNQVFVQHDRQNFLNLLLGGVHEVEGKSAKEEALAFFHDVLELPTVKEKDIIKAYRKTAPKEFDEHIEDEEGNNVVLNVQAPGVMFVRLQSERVREQIMVQARGLGGRRHPVFNHKYFVSPVECEATKATKGKYRNKVQSLLKGNRDTNTNDKFYFQGDEFFINGTLQEDTIMAPTFAEVADTLRTRKEELDALQLHRSEVPHVQNNNKFIAYFIHTRRIDIIRLAYTRVYVEQPSASSVMMAYKLANTQGSCDDGEYNMGFKLLRLLQNKKIKHAAIFMARYSRGQHLGAARFQVVTEVAAKLIDSLSQDDSTELGSPEHPSSPQAETSSRGCRRARKTMVDV